MSMQSALSKLAKIDLAPVRATLDQAKAHLAELATAEQNAERQAGELSKQIRDATERGRDGAALADALIAGHELPSADIPALRERLDALRSGIAVLRDRKREQLRVIDDARHALNLTIGAAVAPARDTFEETAIEAVQALLDAHATLSALIEPGSALCLSETRRTLGLAIAAIQYSPLAANLTGTISQGAVELLRAGQAAIELSGRSLPNEVTLPARRGFFAPMRAA